MNVNLTNPQPRISRCTLLPKPRGEEGLFIAMNHLNKWMVVARQLGVNIDEQVDKLVSVITDAPVVAENPRPIRITFSSRDSQPIHGLIHPGELLATQQMAFHILYCNQIIRKIAVEHISKRKQAEINTTKSEYLKDSITDCAERALKELTPERSLASPEVTGIHCMTVCANYEIALKTLINAHDTYAMSDD